MEIIKGVLAFFLVLAVITLATNRIGESVEEGTKENLETFDLNLHTVVKDCVNGWWMIERGRGGWIYPRDEDFKPIPCGENNVD